MYGADKVKLTRTFFKKYARAGLNLFKKYSVVFGLFTLATANQIPSPKFLNNRVTQAARFKLARDVETSMIRAAP